jgi:DeoR/GlpR family transcriptional regulator of sugar metabolism
MVEQRGKQSNHTNIILHDLRQPGSVSVEALRDKLEVSLATVRRELRELEERGPLRQIYLRRRNQAAPRPDRRKVFLDQAFSRKRVCSEKR